MGFEIVLEDEQGKRIDSTIDPTNILHRLLPAPDDRSFCHLSGVDWYGNTVFNRQQIENLIQELRRIGQKARSGDEQQLLECIVALALRCLKSPHLYLKFYGD